MPLTDTAIRAAKPKDKTFKLFDSRGALSRSKPRWRALVALEVPVRR